MKPHNEQYAMELIIAKVKNGDVAAFGVLVDEHKGMAFTLALRLLKSREDAEEVTQDSFLKAYKKLNHKYQNFPIAYKHQNEILSLPNDSSVTSKEINFIINRINNF